MRSAAHLALALLTLGLLVFTAPAAQATPGEASSEAPTPRPPLVVVRGLGPVPSEHLRTACRVLLDEYPVRCEIRGSRSVFEAMEGWEESREQLDARLALDALFRSRPTNALVEVNITTVDIYEADKPYVFGLASLTDRVAVVSLARISDDTERLPHRLEKLVLHETGHALGLPHHDDVDCAMRQDPTVDSLDTAPGELCEVCHGTLKTNATKLARPGQIALDRARGHLARGEVDKAREQLVATLWSGEGGGELLNGFALAFIEARHWNEAISVLKHVIKAHPDYPEAHVNLGLAYQMRSRPGDLDRAIYHFERAVNLRPDWELVQAHLDGLTIAPSAQGPE